MAQNKLPAYLHKQRTKQNLTLRDIEKLSKGKISNPYFSQLENYHTIEPSPIMLREIARVMKLDYLNLLILAGYITKREILNHKAERLLKALKRAEQ